MEKDHPAAQTEKDDIAAESIALNPAAKTNNFQTPDTASSRKGTARTGTAEPDIRDRIIAVLNNGVVHNPIPGTNSTVPDTNHRLQPELFPIKTAIPNIVSVEDPKNTSPALNERMYEDTEGIEAIEEPVSIIKGTMKEVSGSSEPLGMS